MLLVPMTGEAAGKLARTALSHEARLIAEGPIPGSMIVRGKLADFPGAMIFEGMLLLSAPQGGCGDVK